MRKIKGEKSNLIQQLKTKLEKSILFWMRFCPDSPSFLAHILFEQLLFLAWLHLSGPHQPGVFAQCDAELPSGNTCTQEDFFMEADPEVSSLTLQMQIYKIKKFCTLRSKHFYAVTQACSFFYECSEGCVSHKQCQPHEDGLPRVFDDVSVLTT